MKRVTFVFGTITALLVQPFSIPSASAAVEHTTSISGSTITVDWDDVPEATNYSVVRTVGGEADPAVSAGATSVYQDTDTLPNTEYTYTVSSTVPSGNQEPDTIEEQFVTTMLSYPLGQLTASVEMSSYNDATISFDEVHGVDTYQIYRSNARTSGFTLVGSTAGTSYVDANLEMNKTYYYQMRGRQTMPDASYQYTDWTAVRSVRPTFGQTSLSVSAVSHSSIRLTWSASDGATKYKIYRSTSRTGGYKLVDTVTSRTYSSTGLKLGTRYYFKVIPARLDANGSATNIATAVPRMDRSTIYKVKMTLGKATLSWSDVAGASGYRLYRATSEGGSYRAIATTKSRSYTNQGLGNNDDYYYKVKPYKSINGKGVFGDASAAFKIVTPLRANQYQLKSSGVYVLETSGYGYYEVCDTTRCEWGNGTDTNDNFENRAYVYVQAGQYLTFSSPSSTARITKGAYYYSSELSGITKPGHYLVGFDLKPGNYRLGSSEYYYYSICEWVFCDWGNGYDTNDLVSSGGVRYITVQDGDFLTISGSLKGVRY